MDDSDRVELIRDTWGIPHVFASSDEGAMYGLGYATAEDRGFQMYYALRVIQGRASELLGVVSKGRRRETTLESDRKMRTFGFYRAAKRVAERLDEPTLKLLEAYCRGVNEYFARHGTDDQPLFARYELEPEPWTPADCLVSWWHIAQFFGTDGTRDLMASRGPAQRAGGLRGGRPMARPPVVGEEAAAVVQRRDVTDQWLDRLQQFTTSHGLRGPNLRGDAEGPKFSHAWVVGGAKTTTGSAVLVSDPQTMVGNPSMFYEFHIQGATFNARGIGVPGSPVILIGFTKHVAWGMTALGADQADLFRLKTDREHPDQYFFKGQWKPMTVVRETIRVRGGDDEELIVRETHFGPVVTNYVFARPEDGQFAVKRVPMCETDRETVQGAFAMLRARDADAFAAALEGWRFPSANVVFGDTSGKIGYWVLGALPVRSSLAEQGGRHPHDGTDEKYDWQGMIPHDLKPHVLDPDQGYLFSGNHRPVGAFYPLYIGHSTGSMGDTLRSWRLRELLAAKPSFRPEDVLAVHYDMVNPARRDIARLGYHLRGHGGGSLSPESQRALKYLESWYDAGCPSDLSVAGAELAMEINTLFRIVSTDLAMKYGGGESGLALFLKTVTRRLDANPDAALDVAERRYVDQVLRDAWNSALSKYGADSDQWLARARETVTRRRLGYFQSLDGFPSLDPERDLPWPALACVDGATVRSQGAQAYTQYVPLHAIDQAQSLLPIGTSERPGDPSYRSTYALWAEGKLHPAPLSRAAVQRLAAHRQVLHP